MGFGVFTMIPMWGQFALAMGHRSERVVMPTPQ